MSRDFDLINQDLHLITLSSLRNHSAPPAPCLTPATRPRLTATATPIRLLLLPLYLYKSLPQLLQILLAVDRGVSLPLPLCRTPLGYAWTLTDSLHSTCTKPHSPQRRPH
jgi:hypothetical protein